MSPNLRIHGDRKLRGFRVPVLVRCFNTEGIKFCVYVLRCWSCKSRGELRVELNAGLLILIKQKDMYIFSIGAIGLL